MASCGSHSPACRLWKFLARSNRFSWQSVIIPARVCNAHGEVTSPCLACFGMECGVLGEFLGRTPQPKAALSTFHTAAKSVLVRAR